MLRPNDEPAATAEAPDDAAVADDATVVRNIGTLQSLNAALAACATHADIVAVRRQTVETFLTDEMASAAFSRAEARSSRQPGTKEPIKAEPKAEATAETPVSPEPVEAHPALSDSRTGHGVLTHTHHCPTIESPLGDFQIVGQKPFEEGGEGRLMEAHLCQQGLPSDNGWCIKQGLDPENATAMENGARLQTRLAEGIRKGGIARAHVLPRTERGHAQLAMKRATYDLAEYAATQLNRLGQTERERQAAAAVQDVAETLGQIVRYAQKAGIPQHQVVHRDLKPGNILVYLEEDGTITLKLTDFGSGARAGVSLSLSESAGKSQMMSTLFMSLELTALSSGQIKETDLDMRSSLQSLGYTLLYLLGGQKAVRSNRVPDGVSDTLKQIIETAIHRDTGTDGYQTPEGMMEALQIFLDQHTERSLSTTQGQITLTDQTSQSLSKRERLLRWLAPATMNRLDARSIAIAEARVARQRAQIAADREALDFDLQLLEEERIRVGAEVTQAREASEKAKADGALALEFRELAKRTLTGVEQQSTAAQSLLSSAQEENAKAEEVRRMAERAEKTLKSAEREMARMRHEGAEQKNREDRISQLTEKFTARRQELEKRQEALEKQAAELARMEQARAELREVQTQLLTAITDAEIDPDGTVTVEAIRALAMQRLAKHGLNRELIDAEFEVLDEKLAIPWETVEDSPYCTYTLYHRQGVFVLRSRPTHGDPKECDLSMGVPVTIDVHKQVYLMLTTDGKIQRLKRRKEAPKNRLAMSEGYELIWTKPITPNENGTKRIQLAVNSACPQDNVTKSRHFIISDDGDGIVYSGRGVWLRYDPDGRILEERPRQVSQGRELIVNQPIELFEGFAGCPFAIMLRVDGTIQLLRRKHTTAEAPLQRSFTSELFRTVGSEGWEDLVRKELELVQLCHDADGVGMFYDVTGIPEALLSHIGITTDSEMLVSAPQGETRFIQIIDSRTKEVERNYTAIGPRGLHRIGVNDGYEYYLFAPNYDFSLEVRRRRVEEAAPHQVESDPEAEAINPSIQTLLDAGFKINYNVPYVGNMDISQVIEQGWGAVNLRKVKNGYILVCSEEITDLETEMLYYPQWLAKRPLYITEEGRVIIFKPRKDSEPSYIREMLERKYEILADLPFKHGLDLSEHKDIFGEAEGVEGVLQRYQDRIIICKGDGSNEFEEVPLNKPVQPYAFGDHYLYVVEEERDNKSVLILKRKEKEAVESYAGATL